MRKVRNRILILLVLATMPIASYAQNQRAAQNDSGTEVLTAIEWFKQGAYDSANFHFHRGIALFAPTAELSHDEFHKRISVLLTHSYKAMGERDSAIFYAANVIRLAKVLGEEELQAEYIYTLATIYNEHSEPAQAEKYYLEAADLAQRIGYNSYAASCYGAASVITPNKQYAVTFAKMALECARRQDDHQLIASQHICVATAYCNNSQFEDAANSYRMAMECYEMLKDVNGYKLAQSGLMYIHNKMERQDSANIYLKSPGEKIELTYKTDSLAAPNSMQGVKLDLLSSRTEAGQRALELDVMSRQYWQEQADSMRMRVWLISIVGGLVILILLLLYGRQKLRSRARSRYIEGLESERERIAKELHDGVCNDLLALEMSLNQSGLNENIGQLQTVRNDVRMLSHELMPPAFQYAAIDEILLDYISRFDAPPGIQIVFNHSKDTLWGDVSHSLAFQIYRITQEAVANSLKHAAPTLIAVDLARIKKQITLTITDDGRGFAADQKTEGVGLRTLRDRAASIGAALEISTTSAGTIIRFTYNDYGKKSKHITS